MLSDTNWTQKDQYDSIWESTILNTESSQVYVERKQKGGCHGLRGKGNGVSI